MVSSRLHILRHRTKLICTIEANAKSPAEPLKKELHWVGLECCFPLLNDKWSCNTANLHHGLAGRLLLCSSLLLQGQQICSILIVTCSISERNKYISLIPYSRPSIPPCDLPSAA